MRLTWGRWTKNMMKIDDRDGSRHLAKLVRTECKLARLNSGDVAFTGNGPEGKVHVGVEVKRLHDFLNSTERLTRRQLPEMMEEYDVCYLVVEGLWRFDKDTGVLQSWTKAAGWRAVAHGRLFNQKFVDGFIATLIAAGGGKLNVWRTSNDIETAGWLDVMADWWGKEWEGHTSHLGLTKSNGRVGFRKPNVVEMVAAQLPGIGMGKARNAAKEFGSVREMVMAGEEEWRNVEGVGEVMAKNVVKALGKKERR